MKIPAIAGAGRDWCGRCFAAAIAIGLAAAPVAAQVVIEAQVQPVPPPGFEQQPDLPADSTKPESKPAAAERPVRIVEQKPLPPDFIRLYLMDGSVLAGRLSLKEIAVETQFGQLSVPVASIKRFYPGLQSHPALAKEITGLIADLGSSNYNDREKAQQALIKMGLSIRDQIKKHENDDDVERRNRIKAILTELEQQLDDSDSFGDESPETAMRQHDTIETTEFTIAGKIVPQSFAVTSPYGELNVKLADVRKGERDTDKKEEIHQTFSVDGSHLTSRRALNTNIRLQRGDSVTVVAEGTITMTPWGGNAVTTPDGAQNYGWYIPGQIPSGMLVGKVGDDNYFKLGSKTTFTAERSGVLQLAVAMQADYAQNQFPGKYTVKVRVQRKE
jgi:hypothetical protein